MGSFIEDKFAACSSVFSYKHHYLLHALESDVLLDLLAAMERRQCVRIESCSSRGNNISFRVLPLKIYVSTQSGRRYVMCWFFKAHRIIFCRLDNLERVLEAKPVHDYDKFCAMAEQMEQHLWGVSMNRGLPLLMPWSMWSLSCASAVTSRIFCNVWSGKAMRTSGKTDAEHYRFIADVHDAGEMLPWLRTFIGRIESFSCSNKAVEEKFWQDLAEVYAMYGVKKAGEA